MTPSSALTISRTGWVLAALGLICSYSILGGTRLPDDWLSLMFIGLIASFVASSFWAVSSFMRDTNASRDELTKRIAEQDERIRKLEEQLVALTAPRTH